MILPQLKRLLQELYKSKGFPKTKGREKANKRRNEEIGESIEEQRKGILIRWVVVPLEKRRG